MKEIFLKLHRAQNQAQEVLLNAGFNNNEIHNFNNDNPTQIVSGPNLLYIIFQLDLENDSRLSSLLEIINGFEN